MLFLCAIIIPGVLCLRVGVGRCVCEACLAESIHVRVRPFTRPIVQNNG